MTDDIIDRYIPTVYYFFSLKKFLVYMIMTKPMNRNITFIFPSKSSFITLSIFDISRRRHKSISIYTRKKNNNHFRPNRIDARSRTPAFIIIATAAIAAAATISRRNDWPSSRNLADLRVKAKVFHFHVDRRRYLMYLFSIRCSFIAAVFGYMYLWIYIDYTDKSSQCNFILESNFVDNKIYTY